MLAPDCYSIHRSERIYGRRGSLQHTNSWVYYLLIYHLLEKRRVCSRKPRYWRQTSRNSFSNQLESIIIYSGAGQFPIIMGCYQWDQGPQSKHSYFSYTRVTMNWLTMSVRLPDLVRNIRCGQYRSSDCQINRIIDRHASASSCRVSSACTLSSVLSTSLAPADRVRFLQ